MSSLKTPFIISVLFHRIALFSLAVFYQPAREAFMNITPVEFIHLPQEEKGIQQRPKQKAAAKKAEAVQPSKTEEKREEIKKEPEKPAEERKTAQAEELPEPPAPVAPAASETDAGISAAAPVVTEVSKYGLEGGTGKGSGDELALFRTMVRTKIERAKFYPRWARERGFEGVVGVRFVILPDGKVDDVKVVRPCHCEILNRAACEAIKKASPFNPRPKELEGREMAMEIDISFRLE